MANDRAVRSPRPGDLFLLWFGFLGGPIAWSARLLISYPLVPVACDLGSELILHAVTAVTALLAISAGAVSLWNQRRLGNATEADAGAEMSRWPIHFARAGAWLSALFLLAILAEGMTVLLESPCR